MPLYNFQKRFAPMILSGAKRHTIRAKRNRQTMPGETLHLYTGLRQKGAQLLMRVRCTKVEEITISSNCKIKIDGTLLTYDECDQLAWADGFINFADMMCFWNGHRPFRGDMIHWQFQDKEGLSGGRLSSAVPKVGLQERSQERGQILQPGMSDRRLERAQRQGRRNKGL